MTREARSLKTDRMEELDINPTRDSETALIVLA